MVFSSREILEKFIRELCGIAHHMKIKRYSYSARAVIRQDTSLKCDQIRLPFHALCELYQQVIINILTKSFTITYADAYKRWFKAQITGKDTVVWGILQGLINDSPNGLPIVINRNPTIAKGGILSVKCVGINDDYTMSLSLLVLILLAADFDQFRSTIAGMLW